MKTKFILSASAVLVLAFLGFTFLGKATSPAPQKLTAAETKAHEPIRVEDQSSVSPSSQPERPAEPSPAVATSQPSVVLNFDSKLMELTPQEIAALDKIVNTRRKELYQLLMSRADIVWVDSKTVSISTDVSDAQARTFRDAVQGEIVNVLGKDRSEVVLSSTQTGKNIRDELENFGEYKIGYVLKFDGANVRTSSLIEVAKSIEGMDPRSGRPYAYTTNGRITPRELEGYIPGALSRLP